MHQAKTHLSRLADRAHQGEEIVLSKAGEPWARIVPLNEPQQPQPIPVRILKEPHWFAAVDRDEPAEMFGEDNADLSRPRQTFWGGRRQLRFSALASRLPARRAFREPGGQPSGSFRPDARCSECD
ncbi:MAG: type II toxin-antitoxin system Phd/YefM family antitoxin [Nesterenkonia sp.]